MAQEDTIEKAYAHSMLFTSYFLPFTPYRLRLPIHHLPLAIHPYLACPAPWPSSQRKDLDEHHPRDKASDVRIPGDPASQPDIEDLGDEPQSQDKSGRNGQDPDVDAGSLP